MKLLNLFKKRYLQLLLICIVGIIIVTSYSAYFQTTFGYDMARDAFHAHDILFKYDFMILGPGTDIPGLNHGVLWFYILVIPYLIARQDPQFAVIPFIILSIATIPFVWLLAERLFKNKTVSIIGTVLYGFSPLVVALASWMSNPILCLYVTPPLLLVIHSFLEKPTIKKGLLIGIFYGILIQSQLANLLFLATIPLFLVFFRVKPSIKVSLSFLLGLFVTLSSYLAVEMSFHWRGVFGLLAFLKNHHSGGPKWQFIADKILEFFNLTVFPFSPTLIVVCIIFLFIFLIKAFKKERKSLTFLSIWLSNILLFTYFDTGVSHSSFVFIPSIAAGVLLVTYILVMSIRSRYILTIIVAGIIVLQIKTVISWQKNEFSPAAIQRSNTAYRYKAVVDYTYNTSQGQKFTIISITNPLYINTTWAYLYEFYGKKKYGYEPFWGGKGQVGYPGNLTEKPFSTKDRYLIIESTIGVPSIYVTKIIYEEDRVSDIIEVKKFGDVIVQKRVLVQNKPQIPVPEELKNSSILNE